MKKILTIAGSDCSGGAGIQADLKTIAAHGHYGMSVITALTAQNTTGVYGVLPTTAEMVEKQIDAVFSDIEPDAVKIGMVAEIAIIECIARKINQYKPRHIVIDPVMISTSGHQLMAEDVQNTLIEKLLPHASIVTPNIAEAEVLAGMTISDKSEMEQAARKISRLLTGAVLIKGGHLSDCADDLLYHNERLYWFIGRRIHNPNSHGTGCTLSSAIACNLAMDLDYETSIKGAKDYVRGALSYGLDLGKGSGPLNHCFGFKTIR